MEFERFNWIQRRAGTPGAKTLLLLTGLPMKTRSTHGRTRKKPPAASPAGGPQLHFRHELGKPGTFGGHPSKDGEVDTQRCVPFGDDRGRAAIFHQRATMRLTLIPESKDRGNRRGLGNHRSQVRPDPNTVLPRSHTGAPSRCNTLAEC